MSSSDLIRWGGLAAMLCGVLFVVLFAIPQPPPGSFLDGLGSAMFIVALLLLLAGLVGFHALQKANYGRIGRTGAQETGQGRRGRRIRRAEEIGRPCSLTNP